MSPSGSTGPWSATTLDAVRLVSVVVAGGSGSRMGGTALKQFATVAGRPMLEWAVDAVGRVSAVVIVVIPAGTAADVARWPGVEVTAGGTTRAASVRAGLEAARRHDPTHVLIHDAARPCVPVAVVDRVVEAMKAGRSAVVPVVAVTDTLRWVDGGTVDRSRLCAVQTPQGFAFDVIEQAHATTSDATDDAGLVDALGLEVHHVEGDPANIKVTVAADLALAEILLA